MWIMFFLGIVLSLFSYKAGYKEGYKLGYTDGKYFR